MTTRVTLRREMGLRAGQPWFMRFGKVAGTATGGTTTTLVDTGKLLQEDHFWRGSFLYLPTIDTVRVIDASTQSSKTLTFLEPLASAVQSGDAYEIWSQFSPHQIHDAINQSLRSAWPAFFTVNEGRLVLQEEVGVDYSLASLSPTPKWVARLQMEAGGFSSDTGTSVASPGGQDYLKDTNKTFTSDNIGQEVRVYGGTSKGDIRTVSALVDANTLQVSTNFTSTLDATSKYRLVDVLGTRQALEDVLYWSVDSYTTPSYLRLGVHPCGWEGHVLRVVYEAEYVELTGETSSVTAPMDWLVAATLAQLYLMKIASAPTSERSNWVALQRTYAEAADSIAQRTRYQHMTTQLIDDQGAYGIPADYPFSQDL